MWFLFSMRKSSFSLIEPNPFYLLRQNSYWGAFDEAQALRDTIKTAGNTDSWEIAAAYFADYWNGAGHMAPLAHPQMINPIINNLLLKT